MIARFLLMILLIFFSCGKTNQENNTDKIDQNPVNNIEINNIGYIVVDKDSTKYEIRDKEELKSILSNLKDSHLKYIKFGSKDKFTIHKPNGEVIFTANYGGDKYKINSVVYEVNQNLFE